MFHHGTPPFSFLRIQLHSECSDFSIKRQPEVARLSVHCGVGPEQGKCLQDIWNQAWAEGAMGELMERERCISWLCVSMLGSHRMMIMKLNTPQP